MSNSAKDSGNDRVAQTQKIEKDYQDYQDYQYYEDCQDPSKTSLESFDSFRDGNDKIFNKAPYKTLDPLDLFEEDRQANTFPSLRGHACSGLIRGLQQSTNIIDVLMVIDHCSRRLGNANHFGHYFFCGSRHFSLDEPTFFSVSNAPQALLELAHYPKKSSANPWRLKDPFLSCVPKEQFMPFYWSRRDLEGRCEPGLLEVLTLTGIVGGVSFVSRGITQDVTCLTLMVSETQIGDSSVGHPEIETSFALHGMGVHFDLETPTGLLSSKPITGRVFGRIKRSCQPLISSALESIGSDYDDPMRDLYLEFKNDKFDRLWRPDDVPLQLSDMEIWSKVNLLTASAMDRVRQVVEFLGKRPDFPHDELIIKPHLSEQEINVARHMVAGLMSKVIAHHLNCSTANVNYHIRGIYKKLRVNTRGAAVSKLQALGVGDKRTGSDINNLE